MRSHRSTDTGSHRVRVGLCSVTFRSLGASEVLGRAAEAGLESIEWASDSHVRPGDLDAAAQVGEQTRAAGLAVASYGSYLRFPWAREPYETATELIGTGVALGAPRVRVWAGPYGSKDATAEQRQSVIDDLRRTAALAAAKGVEVAVEYHSRTLADDAPATVALLAEVAADNLSTYWQPRIGASDDAAVADLDALLGWVSTVHVFSWGDRLDRHPLVSREAMWRRVFARLCRAPRVTDALLEFLPDDDPGLLAGEAAQAKAWRDQALTTTGVPTTEGP